MSTLSYVVLLVAQLNTCLGASVEHERFLLLPGYSWEVTCFQYTNLSCAHGYEAGPKMLPKAGCEQRPLEPSQGAMAQFARELEDWDTVLRVVLLTIVANWVGFKLYKMVHALLEWDVKRGLPLPRCSACVLAHCKTRDLFPGLEGFLVTAISGLLWLVGAVVLTLGEPVCPHACSGTGCCVCIDHDKFSTVLAAVYHKVFYVVGISMITISLGGYLHRQRTKLFCGGAMTQQTTQDLDSPDSPNRPKSVPPGNPMLEINTRSEHYAAHATHEGHSGISA